jgi:hypothetical protein
VFLKNKQERRKKIQEVDSLRAEQRKKIQLEEILTADYRSTFLPAKTVHFRAAINNTGGL